MRVRYLGTPGAPHTPENGGYYLKPGGEYVVLELHIKGDGASSLRIEHTPGELAGLFSGKYFEQVSHSIPSQWSVEIYQRGGLSMGPKEWIADDFWERMMERDPEAELSFEATRDAIMAEEAVT